MTGKDNNSTHLSIILGSFYFIFVQFLCRLLYLTMYCFTTYSIIKFCMNMRFKNGHIFLFFAVKEDGL